MLKKKQISPIKLTALDIIVFLIEVIIIGFLLEVGSGILNEKLKGLKLWHEDFHNQILVGIGILVFVIWIIIKTYINKEKALEKEEWRLLRKKLLLDLKSRYESRLKEKMVNELRFEINLKLKYTKKGTPKKYVKENFVIKDKKSVGGFDTFFNTYLNKIRRLLILGEPGVGKTVLMLRLALKLIEIALKNPEFPIPIVLDLASWSDNNHSFKKWLEEQLQYAGGESGISKAFSKELVDRNIILPLLDGFDEITNNYRQSCLSVLIQYLEEVRKSKKETYPEIIICSRINEYKDIEIAAPVFASIQIQPLTYKYIKNVLSKLINENDLSAKKVKKVLSNNFVLKKSISTSFYFHILLHLFSNPTTEPSLKFLNKQVAKTQKELVKSYINLEVKKLGGLKDKSEKIKKWLGWLAWQLKFHKKGVTFELSDMQPSWLKNKNKFRIFACLFFIIPFWGFIGYIINNIFWGGIGLLSSIIYMFSSHSQIVTKEELTLNSNSIKSSKSDLFSVITSFIIIGIIYSLGSSFIFKLIVTLLLTIVTGYGFYLENKKIIYGISRGLLWGGVIGFFFISTSHIIKNYILGLLIGLSLGIFSFFSEIIVVKRFPKLNKPYSRLTAQIPRDLFFWTFGASTIIGLIYFMLSNSYYGFFIGGIIGFLQGIGITPIFDHLILRIILVMEKFIPIRYSTFLNIVVKNSGLMVKDGGQWRFRHQLINDYLANWFEENYLNKPQN